MKNGLFSNSRRRFRCTFRTFVLLVEGACLWKRPAFVLEDSRTFVQRSRHSAPAEIKMVDKFRYFLSLRQTHTIRITRRPYTTWRWRYEPYDSQHIRKERKGRLSDGEFNFRQSHKSWRWTHTFLFIRGENNHFIGKTKKSGADIGSETITVSVFQEGGVGLYQKDTKQKIKLTIPSRNTETKLKIRKKRWIKNNYQHLSDRTNCCCSFCFCSSNKNKTIRFH